MDREMENKVKHCVSLEGSRILLSYFLYGVRFTPFGEEGKLERVEYSSRPSCSPVSCPALFGYGWSCSCSCDEARSLKL